MEKPAYVYQNFILDSTRWNSIELREGDIVVVTPYKSGTTWVQYIINHLLHKPNCHFNLNNISPWIENRIKPISSLQKQLNELKGRRVLKTHLPADGISIMKHIKYIYVGRDPRDVFISLWNQYSSYSKEFYELVNSQTNKPLPPCPQNINEFWVQWLTRGTFEWEEEGYPHWSFFRHLRTWWEIEQSNVYFIHYNDLLNRLDNTILKIANFCGIEYSNIIDYVTFESMKANAEIIIPNSNHTYKKGNSDFFKTGKSNNWQKQLKNDDIYHITKHKHLSQAMITWIEEGTHKNV